METTRPEDIGGVNTARQFLGVDRDVSDRKIERVFEAIAENVQDETYWAAVKAREIALADAVADGTTVYNVLRKQVEPEDLLSVADAQRLFDAAPPPKDSRNLAAYNRGIGRTADWAKARLETLAENSEAVSESNILAVRVARHALRLRNIEEGKQYVLGQQDD